VVPWFGWVGFLAFVAGLITLDLLLFHRRPHEVHTREALVWSGFYVAIGLSFAGLVALTLGGKLATEYLAGYVIEWSLSVDNIFVFVLVITQFEVPAAVQQKVLMWGVMGAVVLRLAFILGGSALLHSFEWAVYVFGGILLVTAIRFVLERDRERSFHDSRVLKALERVVPVTDQYEGERFLVRRDRVRATPLLAVLVLIIVTDVVFAVDSIPAIFAVTTNAFVAFSSNALAVMGLRPLFFVLEDAVARFRFLKLSLAVVLAFVGTKMIVHNWVEIPTALSLAVVAGVMAVGVAASWLFPASRRTERRMSGAPGR
jgi:tellurite resistance protein TerC